MLFKMAIGQVNLGLRFCRCSVFVQHCAAMGGSSRRKAVAELLLKKGLDVNVQNREYVISH